MSSTMESEFRQIRVVTEAHAIPRFGHSSSIAKLTSHSRAAQEDYIRGILSFCAFLVTAFFIWGLVLAFFKFVLGDDRVGCAAGGRTLDVAKMRKDRIPRYIRKARILRAWHLQWTFIFVSVFIPITTLLMTRNGLVPLIASLDEVEDIADDVEAKAYVGISISESLAAEREKLLINFTSDDMNFANSCQNPISNLQKNTSNVSHPNIPVASIGEYIQVGLDELETFIDEQAAPTKTGLENIVRMTKRVDESIEWSYANDWALKFFLMVVNVVNGFFLFGIFLTKQDIVSYRYQRFVSYLLFPFWTILMIICMVLFCAFACALLLNADFCYGDGTPEGTIKNIIIERGMTENDLVYTSFQYYVQGCFGDSPLGYLSNMESMMDHTSQAVNLLIDEFSKEGVKDSCSTSINPIIERLPQLQGILDESQQKIRAAVELTGCHQISPILRRILYGTTCSDTVNSLTWLFAGMVTITVLGCILLSIRASLFNAVIRAPRRKRRKEREKEFKEYKQYMSTFYEDASDWKLDDATKNKKEALMVEIPHVETFETEQTSSHESQDDNIGGEQVESSESGSDADSHLAYIQSPKSESSSESSYESDYSSDSEADERSFISQSILGRVFSLRSNNDDNQSSIFGVSTLGYGSEPASESRMSILELQTPRRRRKHLHDPYAFMVNSPRDSRSPLANSTRSPVGSPPNATVTPTAAASPSGFRSLAPTKPKRLIQRTKAPLKEA